jgi:hypothetical protein
MALLKPFGVGGSSHSMGYDLPMLISHLESMCNDEGDACAGSAGRKAKRLAKVEEAVGLLNEALEMGKEE